MNYDYIIVGGGLSGSTLGYLLRKENYKVLIIEKKNIKFKEKLCGGIVTKKAYNILCDLFSEKVINNFVENKFETATIFSKYNILLEDINIHIVNRKKLDNFILNEYLKNGGDIIDNAIIDNCHHDNNYVICNGKKYNYKNLISADGTLSVIRKYIIGDMQERNFSLETFEKSTSKDLKIIFEDKFKGYYFQIPRKEDVCYGIAEVSQRVDLNNKLNIFLKNNKVNCRNIKGAFLPTGNNIVLKKNNIYFIGDAAGLISPITGEGIYYALISATCLAKCLVHNYSYIKEMKHIVKHIKKENILKKLIYNTFIRNKVFNLLRKNNFISRKIKKLIQRTIL